MFPDGQGRLVPVAGGGPANTAVGLARLGVATELIARVGPGKLGALLRDHLEASGVDTTFVVESALPTTMALVDDPVEPHFDIYVQATAAFDIEVGDLPQLADDVAVLHAASLALFVGPSAGAAAALLEREAGRRLISVDPNIRPGLTGSQTATRATFESLCPVADVVRLSDADLAFLYPGIAHEAAVGRLLEAGPTLVVLTRGPLGAIAATAQRRITCPARPRDVVDTVGAGDSFNAAMLAWCVRTGRTSRLALDRLKDVDLEEMLEFALCAAAITCSRRGANPPWLAELIGGAGRLG